MSIRCRVCNAVKIIDSTQIETDSMWECKTCGNILDGEGHINTKK